MNEERSFEEPFFDLLHSLACVHASSAGIERDTALKQIVIEAGKREISPDLLWMQVEKLYPGGLFQEGFTWVDRENFPYDSLVIESSRNVMRNRLRDAGAPNWFDDVELTLIQMLQREEIQAYGIRGGESDVQQISPLEWLDLRFYYGPARAHSKDYFAPNAKKWEQLYFKGETLNAEVGKRQDDRPLHEFRSMQELTADELTITFAPENILQITARDISKRVPLSALELINRRTGQPNTQGLILIGMTQKNRQLHSNHRTIQAISRLRNIFKEHLGIVPDPFHPKEAGWKPRFTVKDNRNAADERAKQNALHVSSDDPNGPARRGFQEYQDEHAGDAADDWLEENDPER